MDSEVLAAVIGGISGIVTACLTSIVTTKGVEKASLRAEQRNARYLAVQVGTSLKKYAHACYGAAHDDGYAEAQRAGGDQCKPTTHVHDLEPNNIEDIDWKSLPSKLMVDVLTFDDKHTAVRLALSDWDEYYDPPDHGKFFTDRQLHYAKLGIEALELCNRLLEETGHTSTLPGAEELKKQLRERVVVLENDVQAREDRIAKYRAKHPIVDIF
jgi:hypothetical protein